jgi:outer membrane immunogenic protein
MEVRDMKRTLIGAAAFLALSSTAVLADGIPSRARHHGFDGCCSWSGTYFGLHLGHGWGDADVTLVPAAGPVFPDSFDTSGSLAGAHLGLNVQLGSIVLGGEFSLSSASIDGSKANCFQPGSGLTCSKEDDWLLLAMGRLGFAFGPSVMAYGTAGWAVSGLTSNVIVPPINANFFRASAVHDGFAYGGGIEYQIPISHWGGCCNSIVLGVEYLHVNLDEKTHQTPLVRDVDQDTDIVRARLSIKLDPCKGCGHRPLK